MSESTRKGREEYLRSSDLLEGLSPANHRGRSRVVASRLGDDKDWHDRQ